tara:strand:+ start:544 stop:1326 length:783 start_codon:yes stop_codon:yes gene_type:complete
MLFDSLSLTDKKESVMNKITILSVASLLLSQSVSAQNSEWSATSVETQKGITSQVINKNSISKSSIATSMSKSANTGQTKSQALHSQGAIQLQQRPTLTNLDNEFWIYDAWVTLRNDIDYDGYAYRFSLEFDADTIYEQADVYARLYLTRGEVFKEYHTTSIFSIYGENTDDSLIVDSELLNGFPTGDYEILIELYDTYTDELVAILDGYSDPDLYLITLESKDYEYVKPVVIVEEHGGSMGWLSLLLLPILMWRKKWFH